MQSGKKVYFASDFHLGVDAKESSRLREARIVRWLEHCAPDAEAIYLLGDVFDFWFEYRTVVPKGYTRLLGALARIRDAGIPVYFFTGNHDMWVFSYFEKELDIPTYRAPIRRQLGNKSFLLGHGDGLGPGDYGYKLIKRVFANPVCQWLFERLHPNFGIPFARFWSGTSRNAQSHIPAFLGPEKEWLIQYCEKRLAEEAIDYFLFGHRHIPIDYTLSNGKSRYINLGEWMYAYSYAVFDGDQVQLHFFEEANGTVYP